MLLEGETVLAAVSGGADSMATLHVLLEVHGQVAVAYFDHRTRDGASGDDGEFVRAEAESLCLRFLTESLPVERPPEAESLSFEEYAREERYAFLTRTAKAHGYAAIATGHHRDDNTETVLMRMIRGASPHGLQGIRPVAERGGVRLIRPLLELSRAEVLAYVKEKGLTRREDSTNADTRFLRNRIRRELLPLLEANYNPRVASALNRLAEAQRAENEYMDAEARRCLESCLTADGNVDRARFAAAPIAIQRRAFLIFAWRHGVQCSFERVDAASALIVQGSTGSHLDLGGGAQLCNAKRETILIGEAFPSAERGSVTLRIPGTAHGFDRSIAARPIAREQAEPFAEYCSPCRQVFESAALAQGATLRPVAEGDRFRPLGLGGTKKLSDYLAEAEVPIWKRPETLVLTSGEAILWVVGHGIGEEAAVHNPAAPLVEIEIHETKR
jgi:tRNA(Ile)-lysidine synthase